MFCILCSSICMKPCSIVLNNVRRVSLFKKGVDSLMGESLSKLILHFKSLWNGYKKRKLITHTNTQKLLIFAIFDWLTDLLNHMRWYFTSKYFCIALATVERAPTRSARVASSSWGCQFEPWVRLNSRGASKPLARALYEKQSMDDIIKWNNKLMPLYSLSPSPPPFPSLSLFPVPSLTIHEEFNKRQQSVN